MLETSKATPRPWLVKSTHAAPEIIGSGRRIVKVLYEGGSEDREVDANAALIVCAVNNFDALLAAAKAAAAKLGEQEAAWHEEVGAERRALLEIIAKVEGNG